MWNRREDQRTVAQAFHNLAKVGVEGSNPFARSKNLQENQEVRSGLRAVFCLPRLKEGAR